MDDGRIGDGMTLEGIAKQLAEIRSGLDAVRSDVNAVRSDVAAVRSNVRSVDGKVDTLGNKMTVEFEETRRVINLGFGNVDILDDKVGRRFDATGKKHDDEIGLLKDVLRHAAKQAIAP